MMSDDQAWLKAREHTPENLELARQVLEDIRSGRQVLDAMRHYPLPGGGYLGKHVLVAAYRQLVERGEWQPDTSLLARIRMKPVRTLSGVTTVTVLTKPYPCPGKCVFCPTDIRMPKSYLPDEPGARRALQHNFEPYDQVSARLEALRAVGHPTDKIELLILGGTWSSYRKDYQEWFIKRCFDAMNGIDSPDLQTAQARNETTDHRNVGLVIETRPDHVNLRELAWLRYLGVTKVQMGAQSFDDHILEMNKRGHTAAETRQAVALLRAAGFKIVLHWMPNLLGADPDSDRTDFIRMWDGYCPDEIKIYPNQLLANAELYAYWQRGEFIPYTTDELVDLISDIKPSIPRYCRVNRVIRDIPSTNVVEGNKRTSLRQDVHQEMARRGTVCQCVRCREVRGQKIKIADLRQGDLIYQVGDTQEHFLSLIPRMTSWLAFCGSHCRVRLHPKRIWRICRTQPLFVKSIFTANPYRLAQRPMGPPNMPGWARILIRWAEQIAVQNGFPRLAVISAIGTRRYYTRRGFKRGETYLVKKLV